MAKPLLPCGLSGGADSLSLLIQTVDWEIRYCTIVNVRAGLCHNCVKREPALAIVIE